MESKPILNNNNAGIKLFPDRLPVGQPLVASTTISVWMFPTGLLTALSRTIVQWEYHPNSYPLVWLVITWLASQVQPCPIGTSSNCCQSGPSRLTTIFSNGRLQINHFSSIFP